MNALDDLAAATEKLRALDGRRKAQQEYVDSLIASAKTAGHGWAEIQRATGMHNRSLQLALKRVESKL